MKLVQIPYDTRRIYCHSCAKDEGRIVEWCCQKLRDVEDELVEHRNRWASSRKMLVAVLSNTTRAFPVRSFHKTQTVGDVIRLGCRVCPEYFAFDVRKQREEWGEHVKLEHRSQGQGQYYPGHVRGASGSRERSKSKRSSYPRSWNRGGSSRWVCCLLWFDRSFEVL